MAVFIVKATVNTLVALSTEVINIPKGYSVKVNSPWRFDWDGLKRALGNDLGGTVVALSNDGTWDWEQM